MGANDFQDLCDRVIPGLLREACGVEPSLADAIGVDILGRAEAFSALDPVAQRVVAAPFVEDVVNFEPTDLPVRLKAATAVVVRNSLLEQAHACGPVNAGGIEAITTLAARPLAEFLTTDRHEKAVAADGILFTSLSVKFPHAWMALSALSIALASGGRVASGTCDASVPSWPDATQLVVAERSTGDAKVVVRSGIEPLMDDLLVEQLREASEEGVFFASSLGRVSRNLDVLLHAIELLLGRGGQILTTNYLLRPDEVWVRKGRLVGADVRQPRAGLTERRGLSGTHRKVVAAVDSSTGAYPGGGGIT